MAIKRLNNYNKTIMTECRALLSTHLTTLPNLTNAKNKRPGVDIVPL